MRRTVTVDNRTSLLDLLREHLGMAGSKKAATQVVAAPAPSAPDGGDQVVGVGQYRHDVFDGCLTGTGLRKPR
ncbi:hypothetical protein [Streptomyces iakyrus]|uniref:hypothetical protein n=1 Tax=Streptomyces iakyrus TaxID=68219 RepID=UPI003D8E5DFA